MDEVDAQKAKLIGGLIEAANSLRNAANFADGFANLLKHSAGGAPVNINPAALTNVLNDAANQIHTATPAVKRGRKKAAAPEGEGAGEEEGGKKKRKRGEKKEKKIRDPNAPKRPPSAYLLFQNEVRKDFTAKFPGRTYHEVLAEISKVWQAMSDTDKAIYNEATSAAKEKFLENKAAYDLSLTNINPNGEPAAASSAAAVAPAPAALPAPAAKPASKKKEAVVAAAAATPKAAASKQPLVPPVPEVTSDDSSSEEASEDDDDESSSEEEEDDEEDERPALKKGKAAQKEEPKAKAQPSRPPPSKGKVVKDTIKPTTSEKDKKKKAKAA